MRLHRAHHHKMRADSSKQTSVAGDPAEQLTEHQLISKRPLRMKCGTWAITSGSFVMKVWVVCRTI